MTVPGAVVFPAFEEEVVAVAENKRLQMDILKVTLSRCVDLISSSLTHCVSISRPRFLAATNG